MAEPVNTLTAATSPEREDVQTFDFPASYSQERLWFVQQIAPDSPAYNLPMVFRLRGRLNVPALERSLATIMDRHEVLRTRFELAGDELRQNVTSRQSLKVRVADLRGDPAETRESSLQRLLEREINQPFNLDQPPLIRALVVRMGETDQALALVVHHIVADGWSLGLLQRELEQLYEAFLANQAIETPALELQFGDYAAWERQQAQAGAWQKSLEYWRKQLDFGARGPTPQLRPDHPRPAKRTFAGATFRMEAPPALSQAVRDLCRRERITLFMLQLAAFETLLHAYSGETDLFVGSPVLNRNSEELEPLIGCLVNLMVLRTSAQGDPTFRDFLRRVREVVLSATACQDVPFERVLEVLRLRRNVDENPLLQVLLTVQQGPIGLRLAGLESETICFDNRAAKFDLFMEWWEAGETLQGRLEYSSELFAAETIARMADHYRQILEAIVAHPEQRLSELTARIPKMPRRAEVSIKTLNAGPDLTKAAQPQRAEISGARARIEQALARIWCQVLRVPEVKRDENFFDLGGHSLLIMQVLSRVRAAFKINLSITVPFEAPTIAELAVVIEQKLVADIGGQG